MKVKLYILFFLFSLFSCERQSSHDKDSFIRGVDISWVSEQEADGINFYNYDGIATDCFDLMHSLGASAVRLRVWVDSENDFCEVADVVAKARRANSLGMEVMIDFHYSDWFADPSRQNKPSAWANLSFDDLISALTNHTSLVLNELKNNNISPKWVQVGNETRNGMLFNDGYLWKSQHDWNSYIALSNAGYDAVKSIFPDASVVIHIDNAWDYDGNIWWFGEFIKNQGKVDIIGLSHYPQTNSNYTWQEMNARCFESVRSLSEKYDKEVIISEFGTKSYNPSLAKQIVQQLSDSLRTIDACLGYFYWEPQVYGGWKPQKYNQLGWNSYDMGAFSSSGQPSDIFLIW